MTALLAASRRLVADEVGIGLTAYAVSSSTLAMALAVTADLVARSVKRGRARARRVIH